MARTRTNHPPDLPHDPTISETCPPGEGALPCSWDGPLDCQALRVQPSSAAARRLRAARGVRRSPHPVRCSTPAVVTQLVAHDQRAELALFSTWRSPTAPTLGARILVSLIARPLGYESGARRLRCAHE